jgi:glycerophosphoryl diester phosphodiesterase
MYGSFSSPQKTPRSSCGIAPLVTLRLVKEVHDAGKKLLTWTVNDRKTMLRLADWKVDGIVSDDTKLLAQTFAS